MGPRKTIDELLLEARSGVRRVTAREAWLEAGLPVLPYRPVHA